MVNAAFVSDLQNRIPKTSCPSCGEPHLEFSMRCDTGSPECLFVARCDRCHMVFGVDADSFPAGVSSSDDIQPARCARCQESLVMVTLSCNATSHSCHYALRCPRCDSH